MEKRKRILLVGFFINLIFVLLFVNSVGAGTRVYYGQVVGIEFSLLQVRGADGRVSVFWCGYKTFVDSRPPRFLPLSLLAYSCLPAPPLPVGRGEQA